MDVTAFTIKRKGIDSILYILLFLLGFSLYMTNQNNFESWSTYTISGILLTFLLLYPNTQFLVKLNKKTITINKVVEIDYKDIQKAYIGSFSFIETFEVKDNLPLKPFKNDSLSYFFNNKHTFLALYANNQVYFIKTNYFTKNSFNKLRLELEDKNISIEKQL